MAYTLANGLLGLADDWTQVARKRSLGLKARQKLVVQFVLGGLLVAFVQTHEGSRLWLPVLGWVVWPWVQAALDFFILVATGNAVNLTDGLDGLAGGTVAIASLAFVPVCLATGALLLDQPSRGGPGVCRHGGGMRGVPVVQLLPGPHLHGGIRGRWPWAASWGAWPS